MNTWKPLFRMDCFHKAKKQKNDWQSRRCSFNVVAMEAEKNAILLYSELAKTAKDSEHREAFENSLKKKKHIS